MAEAALDAVLTLTVESCRGYSAYELAVQHGFQGTEEEWLGSMVAEGNVTVNGKSKDVNGNIHLGAQDVLAANDESVQAALDANAQSTAALGTSLAQTRDTLAALESGKLDKGKLFNELTQTQQGYALDARQGKRLSDSLAQTDAAVAALGEDMAEMQPKLTQESPLAVALGGTGADTKEGALAALGTKAVGWKQLWSGSFKSGSITVTDWSKYRVLAFSIDTSVTVLGVKVHTGRVYLHTVSHSGTEQYVRDLFVNSDGDTVTFGNSIIVTNKGTSPYHEVGTPPAITAIYGVIEQ